jgi:D-erythronate 2-dehydrogenase
MKILITGGGGFLGFKLTKALLARGQLGGKAISGITLLDGAFPPGAQGLQNVKAVTGDVSDPKVIASVCTPDTDAVFHLAAVVSGAAEADFDLGMRVNYKGMELLLAQMRQCSRPPRLVYTSSPPNAAASSFASGILREPLNGVVSECPVAPETGVWLLSPRRVVDAFIHAWELPPEAWGTQRWLNLPGITRTVGEMVDALRKVAGNDVAKRVVYKGDARIQAIVKTWPVNFRTPRALGMGFKADPDVESVIRDYIADENIKL